jgi:7-cyano-7-deazaguanine reductase
MKKDNTTTLLKLGDHGKDYQYDSPDKSLLETFPNQFPERDYITQFIFNEFTSLCPKTKQPDFATITLEYIADKLCIETKSLKTYYLAFRNEGAFMETITNTILEDCWQVAQPRWMKVTANFNARGGTLINVIAEKGKGLKFLESSK